jgi:hypothetical protein
MTAGSLECPRCGRRFAASERFCEKCSMPLVLSGGEPQGTDSPERARALKIRPELTRGPLVRVASAPNQAQAEMMQAMLLEEGVPSVLRRSAGFDVPDFLAAGPRDLLVPESGVETARTFLVDADLPAAGRASSPGRAHVARLAAGVAGGAGAAALIAWALLHVSH